MDFGDLKKKFQHGSQTSFGTKHCPILAKHIWSDVCMCIYFKYISIQHNLISHVADTHLAFLAWNSPLRQVQQPNCIANVFLARCTSASLRQTSLTLAWAALNSSAVFTSEKIYIFPLFTPPLLYKAEKSDSLFYIKPWMKLSLWGNYSGEKLL